MKKLLMFLLITASVSLSISAQKKKSIDNRKVATNINYKVVLVAGKYQMIDTVDDIISCILPFFPHIYVAAPDHIQKGEAITVFTSQVFQLNNFYQVKYKWQVSEGKIIKGNETDFILINTKKISSQKLAVTLEAIIKPSNKAKEILKAKTVIKIITPTLK